MGLGEGWGGTGGAGCWGRSCRELSGEVEELFRAFLGEQAASRGSH